MVNVSGIHHLRRVLQRHHHHPVVADNSEPLVKGYRTMPWSRGRVSPHDGAEWLDRYQGKYPPSTGSKPPAWYKRLWSTMIKNMDHNAIRIF